MNSRDYCTFCPKMCHFSCPVAEAEKDEAVTPWGKQQTARLVDQAVIPLNEESARSAYKCLTCRSSQSFCEHKIIVADSLHEIRERAVASDVAPPEVMAFEQNFRRHNNPYDTDLQEKVRRFVPESFFSEDKTTLFFPTCHMSALSPSSLSDAMELFEKLRIQEVGVSNNTVQCCGYSLWVLGFRKEFEEIAAIQFHSLKKARALVVGAPECSWTFKEIYPKIGLPLPPLIYSLPEYLGGFFRFLPFRARPKTRSRFFYHDACYQGRYLRQYEEPRELLQMVAGFAPEELSWNRAESLCSGAGGGYEVIEPKFSQAITQRHQAEILKKGIKTLVSTCPKAAHRFRSLKNKIVVKDWVTFLNENMLRT